MEMEPDIGQFASVRDADKTEGHIGTVILPGKVDK
jgi:hypothetical protein